jgi:excisionase family DNA binding protein
MRLLTIEDVADRLAVAPVSVRRLVRDGRLVPVRPLGSRAVRFTEEHLEQFIRDLSAAGERSAVSA